MVVIANLRSILFFLYCFVTVVPFAALALPLWLMPPLLRFRWPDAIVRTPSSSPR